MELDEVLKVAKECGALTESWMTNPPKLAMVYMTPKELERFAALVEAATIERCAKVADRYFGCDPVADAIRAITQEKGE